MATLKLFSLSALLGLAFSLSGCQKSETATTTADHPPAQPEIKTLTVGFQKSALNLLVANQQGYLAQQFPQSKIAWKEFPAGPQMLEAIAIGAVDFGYVGNTPPIFAQAANKEIRYLGFEPVSATGNALVVPNKSKIQQLSELKGKRIAVQKGSSAHELLAKVLQKAGLSWSDIQPIWLPPADARAAFSKGSVDAWVVWDPYLSAAELDGSAKVLVDGQAFPATYSFYVASPAFLKQHPQSAAKFLHSVNQADQWVVQHPQQAVEVLAKSTGIDPKIAAVVVQKRPKPAPVQALNAAVIAEQQRIADMFVQVGLIPQKIQVQHNVWTGQ